MAQLRQDSPGLLIVGGGLALVAFLVSMGAWASSMKIASAALAPGRVTAEGNRKAVQARDAGPVKAVLVKEGDRVVEGQPLVELDLSDSKAEVAVYRANRFQLLARRARLTAELNGADLAFPNELLDAGRADPQVQSFMAQERALFDARRVAYAGSVGLFRQQIAGAQDQIDTLNGRLAATKRQLGSIENERASLEPLAEKGIVAKSRIFDLDRAAEGLQADIQAVLTDIAGQTSRVREAEIQITQLDKSRREEASRDLTETEASLAGVEPRLRAASERLDRAVIRSPEDGFVYALSIFSTGATVAAGQTVLEVVPAGEPLVVSIEVNPTDIKRVHPGQDAIIHFLSYNQRYQSRIRGRLERISADMIADEKAQRSYYSALVSVDGGDLTSAGVALVPGMPAEVMVNAGDRTIAEYFLDPIVRVYDYALKEE